LIRHVVGRRVRTPAPIDAVALPARLPPAGLGSNRSIQPRAPPTDRLDGMRRSIKHHTQLEPGQLIDEL
jgi:hypothetical protein